jgi:hypothetical protein
MIGHFLVFEVMEPQVNYIKEFYDPSEILCCYFSCIACLFYIHQTCIFCNSHEIHLELLGTLFCENMSVNKILMRLVKLCM